MGRHRRRLVARFQLGSEIDKPLSILVVTAILALTVVRARRLLVVSVVADFAARDLSRFFAPKVAEQIRRDVSYSCGGCEAAILITDLRGFTKLSATLSAQDLIALLTEYQSRLVPVIQQHGGSIDKYLGDGILASFGAVAPSTSYAADLCRALDDLMATAETWRLERQCRGLPAPAVGMAGVVGEIVFGIVGDQTRLEYTVIGEVVNLVAKLEKHTKVERVQALTTRKSYVIALQQGYRPAHAVEERLHRSIARFSPPSPPSSAVLRSCRWPSPRSPRFCRRRAPWVCRFKGSLRRTKRGFTAPPSP